MYNELTQEQIDFLNRYTKGTWTYDAATGLVDVDGDFECSRRKLCGVKFGKVSGNFDYSSNNLTSLEGSPREVGGDFNCRYNDLTSLKGAPREVGGGFDCDGNNLISLEGAPQKVGGYFSCFNNNLTSLEGAPREVGGYFSCNENNLTSLKGLPKKVGGWFTSDLMKIKPGEYGIVGVMKAKSEIEFKLKEIKEVIYRMCGEGNEEEIKLYLDLNDISL